MVFFTFIQILIVHSVRILRRLVWVSTVCLCHRKRTLGLYGLTKTKINHENKKNNLLKSLLFISELKDRLESDFRLKASKHRKDNQR